MRCVTSSWTARSLRPFLSRAPAIYRGQEHLLGAHKGRSVLPNPSGRAGSAGSLCTDQPPGQSGGFSTEEPGERGRSFVPSVFPVIMISPCSAHATVRLPLAEARRQPHRMGGGEQGAHQGCSEKCPAIPNQPELAALHSHPGLAPSAQRSPHGRKK